jgi:DNA-binding response OmpR family regulator
VLRVLVVDDDTDSAEMMGMLLRLMGHAPSVAHNGEAAVACAATDHPQVVLLDISLPDMDGYEVARQLRARHGQAIRLIALSGWSQEEDRRRAREAGFDHYLTKPAQPEALERLLGEEVV